MNVPRHLPHGPAILTALLLLAMNAADALAADPPRAPAPPPPPWGSAWPNPAVPVAPVAPPPAAPAPAPAPAPPPAAPAAPPRAVAEPREPPPPPPLPPPVADGEERARDLANADRERARDLANADRERARALATAERERERARAEIERARERARAEIERERERTRRGERPRPPAPPPPPPVHKHHHHYHPVFPKGFPFAPKSQVIVIRGEEREERATPRADEPAPPPPPDRAPARPKDDDRGAAGGVAFSAGATNLFGLVPLDGDLMAGARLQLALAAPSESSRWLSNAAFGLTGGVDAGQHRGTDAQVWHAGASFALGAPWSRDVLGVAVEGGLLGGRYYDGNATAYRQSTKQFVPGPVGEGFGPKFYGLGRLVIQVPLKGDVRPFLAGELGATERADDKPSAIAGVTGGLVWNAW